MDDILSFLRAIAAEPADEACRLVFADWLEERGDWRAEFLRLDWALRSVSAGEPGHEEERARWRELRSRLSPSWLAVLGRTEIENCKLQFHFQCPLRWESLAPTDVAATRFCASCRQKVYYCHTIEEARDHAAQRHCVAVDASVCRQPDDLSRKDDPAEIVFLGLPMTIDEE